MAQQNIKQVKGATQGSVLFLGTNGVVSENNSQLYWDNSNNRLGIGTASPSTSIQVYNGHISLNNGWGIVHNGTITYTTDSFNGNSLLIGKGATGTNQAGEAYIALGNNARSTEQGIAIGISTIVGTGTFDGIAIGRSAQVDAGIIRGIAIGRNANVKHNNSWALGYNAITTQDNEFNFGVAGTLHKFTLNGNVGIGTVSNTIKLHVYATQSGAFRLQDTTQGNGYILVSDANGVGTWTASTNIFNGVTGSGTTNYLSRWITSTQLGIGSVYDSGTAVGIATQSDSAYALNVYGDVNIAGTLYATSKSFDIIHPLDSSKRLTYGSLEGPEYGVYVRGKLTNENVINLPDYWTALVDENSITVDITPYGSYQRLFVDKIENNKVYIGTEDGSPNCYYVVYAERKDIPKIIVEQ